LWPKNPQSGQGGDWEIFPKEREKRRRPPKKEELRKDIITEVK